MVLLSISAASIPGFELDIAADARILGHRSSSKLDVEAGADANGVPMRRKAGRDDKFEERKRLTTSSGSKAAGRRPPTTPSPSVPPAAQVSSGTDGDGAAGGLGRILWLLERLD